MPTGRPDIRRDQRAAGYEAPVDGVTLGRDGFEEEGRDGRVEAEAFEDDGLWGSCQCVEDEVSCMSYLLANMATLSPLRS